MTPAPHDTEQSLQVSHSPMTASTGHLSVLHAPTSVPVAQPLPPNADAMSMPRVRVRLPPPQLWLQAPQLAQAPITQSIGHSVVLQVPLAESGGQRAPPKLAGIISKRMRVRVPPPHVALHVLHEPHDVASQSTGHGAVLHAAMLFTLPHGLPPCDIATTTLRERL